MFVFIMSHLKLLMSPETFSYGLWMSISLFPPTQSHTSLCCSQSPHILCFWQVWFSSLRNYSHILKKWFIRHLIFQYTNYDALEWKKKNKQKSKQINNKQTNLIIINYCLKWENYISIILICVWILLLRVHWNIVGSMRANTQQRNNIFFYSWIINLRNMYKLQFELAAAQCCKTAENDQQKNNNKFSRTIN